MINAAKRLEKILAESPSKFLNYSEEQACIKPAPGKWSRKEILGHLVDSAANNHQRFVRMQIDNNIPLPQYQQNEWVALQHYQEKQWKDIVQLWEIYNRHLLHVLKNVDGSRLTHTAIFPEYGVKTLQFIIDDYVDHMEHHFAQILKPVE